jgi:hypothetical protein
MCREGARLRPEAKARAIHDKGYRRFRAALEARDKI